MKKTYTKQTEKKQREEMCKKLKRKHQCCKYDVFMCVK